MQPAARLTDLHVCPMVSGLVPHLGGPIAPPCHVTTLIAGFPAARLTDQALCVGPPDMIVTGAPTTMIAGLPAARVGDRTAHGGMIALGCVTVLIGDSASTGAGGSGAVSSFARSSAGTLQGLTMRKAKRSAKPFCEQCARLAPTKTSVKNNARRTALKIARTSGLPFVEECR